MPYLKRTDREELTEHGLNELVDYFNTLNDEDTAGALNFIIYSLVRFRVAHHGEKYNRYNSLLGAIGEAQAEIRRRLLVPYEERKIKTQGDI